MNLPSVTFSVGQLARRAALTVRTLHHYERIGLLVPSERTAAGHRRYTESDVERLQQIVSLRAIGLPLGEIRSALDNRPNAADVVERHLARVRDHAEHARRLAGRLADLVRLLRSHETASTDDLLEILQLTAMIESRYTPEQLAYLELRREAVGDERIREVEAEWPRLMKDVRTEMQRGTAPADERVLALARRWRGLVEEFTGGDPGVASSLNQLYSERGDHMTRLNGVDPADFRALLEYVDRTMAALDGREPTN